MLRERFARLKHTLDQRQPDLTVLMDGVHKPHNISAILRSSDAVGIHQAHVVSERAFSYKRKKAAAGAGRYVDLKRHRTTEQAYAHLREAGFRLVAAHPTDRAVDYREIDYTGPIAIVLGTELRGMSDYAIESADETLVIPMQGMVQSLNVSVCAALILYEAQRQRQLKNMYTQTRLDQSEYQKTLFEWGWPQLARQCRKHQAPYPLINLETGELEGDIPRGPDDADVYQPPDKLSESAY